jgi:hypothetical protein
MKRVKTGDCEQHRAKVTGKLKRYWKASFEAGTIIKLIGQPLTADCIGICIKKIIKKKLDSVQESRFIIFTHVEQAAIKGLPKCVGHSCSPLVLIRVFTAPTKFNVI